MAKRGNPPAHIPGDADPLMLSGGTITTAYHSPFSVRQIVHAIAAPISFVESQAIETSLFFVLASDSSTDWSANKKGLVYTQTLREGQAYTFFTPNRNVCLPKVNLLVESPLTQNKSCVPNPMYFRFHFYEEQNPQKRMFYQNLFPKTKTLLPKTKLFYQTQSHFTKTQPFFPEQRRT